MEYEEEKGICELVIYCYECKYQLNPNMIAVDLSTNESIWEIYQYILTTKCRNCQRENNDAVLWEREWISKEEALKIWPNNIDSQS